VNGKDFVVRRSSFFPGKKKIFYLTDKEEKNYVFILSKRDYSFFSFVYGSLSNCLLQPIFILPRVTFDNETYFYAALYPKGIALSSSYLDNLDIKDRKKIACSLVKKLQVLHSHGFCHGDVKPRNTVLLNRKVFLIDCEHFFNIPYVLSFSGTKRYKLFPEDFRFYDYFEELFALLCSIFFIIKGEELLSEKDLIDIKNFWQEYQDLKIEDILVLRHRIAKEIYLNVKSKMDSFLRVLDWFFLKIIYFMKNGDYEEVLKFFLNIDASELLLETNALFNV